MKKAVVTAIGGPEVLKIVESDTPVPGPDEVLIRTAYAGVAFADIIMRRGKYIQMPAFPFAPGYDVCGTILEKGKNVKNLNVGDTVLALTQFGGYAQEVCVSEGRVFKAPENISPQEGTALILNYLTAYQMLTNFADLAEGDSVLVFSAAGGVGTAVLQLGKAMNLKMYGVCSDEKKQVVEENGGIAVSRKNGNEFAELRNLCPEGFDLVLDPVGEEHLNSSRLLVKKGGFLVGFGFFSAFQGDEMKGKVTDTILKYIKLRFFQSKVKVRFYSIQPNKAVKNAGDMKTILEYYRNNKIKPLIGKEFSLSDVSEAHRWLSSGKSTGKIVLNCS